MRKCVWMFVTQSRRNYATNVSEILYIRSLRPGITYRILFITDFFNRSGPILYNYSLEPCGKYRLPWNLDIPPLRPYFTLLTLRDNRSFTRATPGTLRMYRIFKMVPSWSKFVRLFFLIFLMCSKNIKRIRKTVAELRF